MTYEEIHNRFNHGYYTNKKPYELRIHYKDPTAEEIVKYCEKENVSVVTAKAALIQENLAKVKKNDQIRRDYYEIERQVNEEFRKDVLSMTAAPNDEIMNPIWSLAWERGHHAGLQEVLICFQDIYSTFEEYIKRNVKIK